MTRRDIFRGIAGLAACPRLSARAPQKMGIFVRMQERNSYLCLLRGGFEITRLSVPIGRGHFVNDVACCLGIRRKCAAELVRKYGLPLEGYGAMSPAALRGERGVIRNADGSVVCVPRELYIPIIEARAAEFAGLVRNGVTALRAGRAATTPILLSGEWVRGLDTLIERGALWKARGALTG